MGLDGNKSEEAEEKAVDLETETSHHNDGEASMDGTEQEDEDDEVGNKIQLGPQCTLKEQLEKDKVSLFVCLFSCCIPPFRFYAISSSFQFFCVILMFWFILNAQDDESLRKWKEQLIGTVDFEDIGGIKQLFLCLFCFANQFL